MRRHAAIRVAVATLVAVLGLTLLGWLGYRRYLAERPIPGKTDSGPVRVAAPLTDRVVLVLVDSMREDVAFDPEISPTFQRIAAKGASGVNITSAMTLTTMSVVSLGTGISPTISWSMKNFDAEPFEDESVFSLLAGAGYKAALLGDASWTQLFGGHAAKTLAFPDRGFFKGLHDGISDDDKATLEEAERVLADPSYAFVVIHVVSADKTAHRAGAHLRGEDGELSDYSKAIRTIDRHVGRLYDRFGGRGTWLMISDHGCTTRGNHGGGEEEARRAPFAWSGPGIAKKSRVEQPLTSMAPTLLALFGLRPPRTSESPAGFDFLTVTPETEVQLASAHTTARERYVTSYLEMVGAPLAELPPTQTTPPPRLALEAARLAMQRLGVLSHVLDASDGGRFWLRVLGVLLGLLLQAALIVAVTRAAGIASPWLHAALWGGASWLLLYYSSWQFKSLAVLGEPMPTVSVLLIRVAALTGLAALGWAVARGLRRAGVRDGRGAAWLGWALFVMILGQSVMRWPYGPLAEIYRAMVLIGVGAAAAYALWRSSPGRVRLALGFALIAAFYLVVAGWIKDKGELSLTETLTTRLVAGGLFGSALVWLGWDALRRGRDAVSVATWLGLGALAAVATAYHITNAAWVIKGFLLLCLLPLAASFRMSPAAARNVTVALALILTRALALDVRLVALILVAGLAVLFSEVRTKNGALTVPASAALVALAHQSLFYEWGYTFSFSSLDMSVAFAATRDAIDLGEGFLFLMVQHLGSWLALTAALLYNRVHNDDAKGVQAAIVALVGTFVVQSWGAFASFEYEIDNHWFTMHAVPLVVFSLCNALLVGLSLAAALGVVPRAQRIQDGGALE